MTEESKMESTGAAKAADAADGVGVEGAGAGDGADDVASAASAASAAPEDCGGSCSSCGVEGCGSRTEPSKYEPNGRSSVKKVFAVVSGKGGVGKSLVTSLLAVQFAKQGKKVAILDADVTGPSIPKAFGMIDVHPTADNDGINPVETANGIKVISVNLLVPSEDTPVAWRGPVVTGILQQFFSEVNWGDIDIMLIDMPPGTSDVFLTIMKMFPVDGIITVSAPQELVSVIVGKAVNLAHDLDVPVIGFVENMAYYECDSCGKRHHIFGEPQGAEVAEKYGIEALGELPINPEFARLVDSGKIVDCEIGDSLDSIIKAIEER